MTGWTVATAATAMLSVAGIGAAFGPETAAQSTSWSRSARTVSQDSDTSTRGADTTWAWEPQVEALRVFGGSGGRIGVSIKDLSDEDLKGGKAAGGVAIEAVETDSPAQKAGFKAGDIVVEFDGERVRSTRQFTRLVQETPSGRSVQAAVLRDGQRSTLTVTPRSGGTFRYFDGGDDMFPVPPTPKVPPPPPPMVFKGDVMPRIEELLGTTSRLGITVDDLPAQLAEYFGAKDGVLVTSVDDNSSASKAGVKAGDVITTLNGGTVTGAADLRRRVRRLEDGDELTLAIVRDKKTMTLKGKLDPSRPTRTTVRTTV